MREKRKSREELKQEKQCCNDISFSWHSSSLWPKQGTAKPILAVVLINIIEKDHET